MKISGHKHIPNDSNQLNKAFYNELLHIIGLYEHKEGAKKNIGRLPIQSRNPGSLLENTIGILNTYDRTAGVGKPERYGPDEEAQTFGMALELCITWLNRILFLKLLEGALLKYDPQNPDYPFLNSEKIRGADELAELFFEVLAVKTSGRTPSINKKYGSIPYLNSSLFEQTELEKQAIGINQLKDRLEIPLHASTVLLGEGGKRRTGLMPILQYLFAFLDAFDFAGPTAAAVREQPKSIINASVLGLIFEKINGYKDGSFFTPGFITMYMCRDTLRNAVLDKFNAAYGFACPGFEALAGFLNDPAKLKEYNETVNSLRICDPAVGSGHFLVSALNEMIAIKSDLGILIGRDGKRMKFLTARVESDALAVYADGEAFEYKKPAANKGDVSERQRIQEFLFREKQTLIENCLFGVDINPKSVHICRLRLWIELLKNAYYTPESGFTELETLPNIDINIKQGNSLFFEWRLEFPEILDENGIFLGFDVVLGNPPYQMIQPGNTDAAEIEAVKNNFLFTEFKIDLFHLFFQQAAKIAAKGGHISYIAPSSLLYNYYVANYRKYLSENTTILRLAVSADKIFEEADVHTAVYFLKNNLPEDGAKTETTADLASVIAGTAFYSETAQSEMKALPGNVWNLLVTEKNASLIKKTGQHPPLSASATINRGLITGDRDKYFSPHKINDKYVEILTGTDVFRYGHHQPKEYVLFEKPKTAGGCWDAEVHLCAHKLAVRQIGTEPAAAFVARPIAVTGNVFTVKAGSEEDEKYILALLNSSLMRYYWKIMFNDFKTAFPQITLFNLGQAPIPAASRGQKKELALAADLIIQKKQAGDAEGAKKAELAADVLVYKLFGLTEGEIKTLV